MRLEIKIRPDIYTQECALRTNLYIYHDSKHSHTQTQIQTHIRSIRWHVHIHRHTCNHINTCDKILVIAQARTDTRELILLWNRKNYILTKPLQFTRWLQSHVDSRDPITTELNPRRSYSLTCPISIFRLQDWPRPWFFCGLFLSARP